LTHQERVEKYCEEHFWWIRNFHKVGWMYANGFIDAKTYSDLSKLKIRKFNGQLATLDKVAQEHYEQTNG